MVLIAGSDDHACLTQLRRLSLPCRDYQLFLAEIISFAVWLYVRFPIDEILTACGIVVSHETIRQWDLMFGQAFTNQIRRRLPQAGDNGTLTKVR